MARASTLLKILAIGVVAVVLVAAVYAALTFPRTIVEFPVSFTLGLDRKQQEFEVPWLHDKAQVEVAITNGTSIWRASISNAQGEVWHNSEIQGGQTTYHSEWITLPSGQYNFTFSIGAGSLDAKNASRVRRDGKSGPRAPDRRQGDPAGRTSSPNGT